MSEVPDREVWAPCNECGRETKHQLLATKEQRHSSTVRLSPTDDGFEVYSHITYDMLECGGCESVRVKRTYFYSEDGEEDVTFYPPAVSRLSPRWLEKLPQAIHSLLKEVYAALHADSRRLAMMGARAILDMVLVQTVADIGGFEKKLRVLEEKGFIGMKNRELLEAALEAGHAASHRGHLPNQDDVNHVIDIVEHLLQMVFVLESAAEDLKKTTPPRSER